MTHVSEAEDVEARLKRAVRNYRRFKSAREELHEAIRAAAAASPEVKKGPKEITFLIDHEYDVAHVSRIIHGNTAARRKKTNDPDA